MKKLKRFFFVIGHFFVHLEFSMWGALAYASAGWTLRHTAVVAERTGGLGPVDVFALMATAVSVTLVTHVAYLRSRMAMAECHKSERISAALSGLLHQMQKHDAKKPEAEA